MIRRCYDSNQKMVRGPVVEGGDDVWCDPGGRAGACECGRKQGRMAYAITIIASYSRSGSSVRGDLPDHAASIRSICLCRTVEVSLRIHSDIAEWFSAITVGKVMERTVRPASIHGR